MLTLSLPFSNQYTNPRQIQYMSILLGLAYHDLAMYETFRQVKLLRCQSLQRCFLRSNMLGGSNALCILFQSTKRFSYSIGPVFKLVAESKLVASDAG